VTNAVIDRVTTSRGSKVTFIALLFAFMAIIGGLGAKQSSTAPIDIPSESQSALVRQLQATLPSAKVIDVVVVYSRPGATLSPSDQATIDASEQNLLPLAYPPGTTHLVSGARAQASFVIVPIARTNDGATIAHEVAAIKTTAQRGLAPGVIVQITGEAGFMVDLQNVFKGADTKLLLVTALVVALLLVITYRSPLLWLVPLLVIGLATQVASALAGAILPHVGLSFDAATTATTTPIAQAAPRDCVDGIVASTSDSNAKATVIPLESTACDVPRKAARIARCRSSWFANSSRYLDINSNE